MPGVWHGYKEKIIMVNAREMKKILRDNGYEYQRCKGSHFIYSNGVNTIAVNKDINRMVARRLLKQYNLQVKE